MRIVSFKVDEDLLELLENLARERQLPKSEIIRRALRFYIDSLQPKVYITRRLRVY